MLNNALAQIISQTSQIPTFGLCSNFRNSGAMASPLGALYEESIPKSSGKKPRDPARCGCATIISVQDMDRGIDRRVCDGVPL